MDEQPLAERRAQAYQLLAQIVRENYGVGRRSYGASLKPTLKRQTEDAFAETELGFATFGEFLKAAATEGVVDLFKAPRGPDWEAVPPGEAQPADTDVSASGGAQPRVRADLWQCFVDWREGYTRVYHRPSDRAYLFANEPKDAEAAEQAAQRALFKDHPEEYVWIDPIPFETQVQWMRDFASEVEDTAAREVLLFAVGRDRPAREFTDALGSKPQLLRRWRGVRVRHVLEVIGSWAREHKLTLEVIERRRSVESGGAAGAAPAAPTRPPRRSETRAALHRAIDRMPESELLRLTIPLEYLLGD